MIWPQDFEPPARGRLPDCAVPDPARQTELPCDERRLAWERALVDSGLGEHGPAGEPCGDWAGVSLTRMAKVVAHLLGDWCRRHPGELEQVRRTFGEDRGPRGDGAATVGGSRD